MMLDCSLSGAEGLTLHHPSSRQMFPCPTCSVYTASRPPMSHFRFCRIDSFDPRGTGPKHRTVHKSLHADQDRCLDFASWLLRQSAFPSYRHRTNKTSKCDEMKPGTFGHRDAKPLHRIERKHRVADNRPSSNIRGTKFVIVMQVCVIGFSQNPQSELNGGRICLPLCVERFRRKHSNTSRRMEE